MLTTLPWWERKSHQEDVFVVKDKYNYDQNLVGGIEIPWWEWWRNWAMTRLGWGVVAFEMWRWGGGGMITLTCSLDENLTTLSLGTRAYGIEKGPWVWTASSVWRHRSSKGKIAEKEMIAAHHPNGRISQDGGLFTIWMAWWTLH